MPTAELPVVLGIDYKPAFNWWVKHMLKIRDRIIASVRKWQTRYLKKSHKLGIELPKTVEEEWRMSEQHLKSYQMGSQYRYATNLCDGIWYLTSKWRISDENQACGRRPHDQGPNYYYIHQHSVKRNSENNLDDCHFQ